MSTYNTHCLNSKIACNISFYHKKNNSCNFSLNQGRFLNKNSKQHSKNKNELKNIQTNLKYNIVNNSIYNNKDYNISKLLTSISKNNRKIQLNFNKYYSPTSRLNKSNLDNVILLKKKQYTSQTNINNKIFNKENNIKDGHITNDKSLNKYRKINKINIDINLSKKIISIFYNKSKNKNGNGVIIKKNSNFSLKNNKSKDFQNKKYNKINNRKIKQYNSQIIKNQSTNILKNYSIKNTFIYNISDKENNKNSLNLNSLGCFSTNSNMSTNTNKHIQNNKTNINRGCIYKNSHINYTSNNIFSISSIIKENKNNKNINKIIEDNNSKYLSQIKIPFNLSGSPRNINSIQNYLKYLKIRQNVNSPKNRQKTQKLSASNINYIHINTESNTSENIFNNTFNYEYNDGSNRNYYKYNKKNVKDIPIRGKSKNNILVSKRNKKNTQKYSHSSFIYGKKEINKGLIECPEEMHFYFVKIFQKGKNINFEKK